MGLESKSDMLAKAPTGGADPENRWLWRWREFEGLAGLRPPGACIWLGIAVGRREMYRNGRVAEIWGGRDH